MSADEAKFKITGVLTRDPRIPPSGKCAFLSVKTVDGKFSSIHDIVCFDPTIVTAGQGDRVTVTGRLGTTKLKDTKRHSSNGEEYDVYAPQLVATAIMPEGNTTVAPQPQTRSQRPPAQPQRQPEVDDSDVPF